MNRYALTIAIVAMLTGCMAMKNENRNAGEPVATSDATPPPGYSPIYVSKVAPLPQQKPVNLVLQPTRVDARNPNTIKVYLHLVDSTGTLYYGGSQSAFKNMWCKIIDSVNGEQNTIKKYTLREATEKEILPAAIAVVMDNSGSMGSPRALAVQNAAAALAERKLAQDALAFVRYDDKTLVEVPLTTSGAEIATKLKKDGLAGFGGMTAIHSGIAEALRHLASNASAYERKAVVIFTDGQENSSSISKDSVVDMALKSGIPVFSVDFGNGVNEGYMQDIARSTGGAYNHVYGTAEFDPLFTDIYKRLKNFYVLEFNTDDFGKHNLYLKMCWGKDSVTTSAAFDNTPDIGSVALLNVPFDYDKAQVKPEGKRSINNVLMLMKAYPGMRIELRGHTDNKNSTKDPNYNASLSQKRADAVRDALVKSGVDASRIIAKGLGDTQPVTSNDTEEGRMQNRRTEFVIISK